MKRARKLLGGAAIVAAPVWLGLAGVGACSSTEAAGGFAVDAEPESSPYDASLDFDAPSVGQDGGGTVFADDSAANGLDAGLSSLCPGSALPADATTPSCANDNSDRCPTCASWAFFCGAWASPQMQGAGAASACHATEVEGGALICCAQPTCVVSTVSGGCDASAQTRYECNGGPCRRGRARGWGARRRATTAASRRVPRARSDQRSARLPLSIRRTRVIAPHSSSR